MKRLFTFAILLLACAQGKAQNYIPFPDSNAIWTERHGNGEAAADIHTYGLKNSDTVFNNITYHKLYFSNDSVLDDNEFWAGLRQDVAAKKVYLYVPGNAETLLFDFSLQPGDMFHGNLQVSYIDSMLLGGVFRKRFTFTHISAGVVLNDQWVEGVGNTDVGGVFGYPSLQPTCDCATSTLCFMQDGQWIYHNSMHTSVTCFKPTAGIDDHFEPNLPVISVYPNPLTGQGHILISQQNIFQRLELYNMSGSKVRSYNVTGKTDIPVSSSDFPGGVYFYRLTGNKGNALSGKMVIE